MVGYVCNTLYTDSGGAIGVKSREGPVYYNIRSRCRTVLMLWKMIVEYCQCLEDIPSSGSDILIKLVELLQVSVG